MGRSVPQKTIRRDGFSSSVKRNCVRLQASLSILLQERTHRLPPSITVEDAAQILELAAAPVNVTVILANEIGQPAVEDLRHVENEDSGDEDPPPKKKKKSYDLVQRVADLETSKEDNIKELKDKKHFGDDLPIQIQGWVTNGVDVNDFFKPIKGNFKGKSYEGKIPRKAYFHNSSSCRLIIPFIEKEITERLKSGSIRLSGKLGECVLPRIIMPLPIEPRKLRLCHDERFLNLWIKDNPFQLENLKHVPRMVSERVEMIALDDKSDYGHVKITRESETFCGFQVGGWVFSYTVLPFGWKASAFIYQSIGMQVTSFLRKLDILTLQYIDDRLLIASDKPHLPHGNINKISYALVELLTRLGIVENLISYLTDIFESVGRGRTWNAAWNVGNPAASEQVKAYLKAVQEEQARSHIVPKHAKPIIINKVRSIAVYISRIITESGRVLEKHVSYCSIYERFRGYLITLGIFEGETPHSMRAGCAIMLALSDNNANTQGLMSHIGWKSERMAHYYTRASTVKDASHVECNLAKSVNYQNNNANYFFNPIRNMTI
ncbi:unnamed protein product [Mytilus coruscus]|uniref:Reverse transcriptase domain-containing protein n=1 Tax=Mytilus coruscus TaxID=42192 RepID=A0A6J8AYC6_MYTCO|nr:unnamed protein product [Mytilus coruscus]